MAGATKRSRTNVNKRPRAAPRPPVVETPKMKYAWSTLPVKDKKFAVEKRRKSLQHELDEKSDDQGAMQLLIQEWVALLMERDLMMRNEFEDEANKEKQESMCGLFEALKRCGGIDFLTDEEVQLKRSLSFAAVAVMAYMKNNNLGEFEVMAAAAPPPPPPPPPPPIMARQTRSKSVPAMMKTGQTKAEAVDAENEAEGGKGVKQSSLLDTNLGLGSQAGSIVPGAAPKNDEFNLELLKSITLGKRQLSRTGVQKSPGGTPAKQRRKLVKKECTTQGELVRFAFENKFKNLASWRSPDSPVQGTLSSPSTAPSSPYSPSVCVIDSEAVNGQTEALDGDDTMSVTPLSSASSRNAVVVSSPLQKSVIPPSVGSINDTENNDNNNNTTNNNDNNNYNNGNKKQVPGVNNVSVQQRGSPLAPSRKLVFPR